MEAIEDLLAAKRDRFMRFSRTNRYRNLHDAYWGNPDFIRRDVQPLWDFRRPSLEWNWELLDDERPRCELIPRVLHFELGLKMYKSGSYWSPRCFEEMDEDKALWVIDHWLRGEALTPPVITYRDEDNTWGKRDGFHRMVIAMMCVPEKIPVWILDSDVSLLR